MPDDVLLNISKRQLQEQWSRAVSLRLVLEWALDNHGSPQVPIYMKRLLREDREMWGELDAYYRENKLCE